MLIFRTRTFCSSSSNSDNRVSIWSAASNDCSNAASGEVGSERLICSLNVKVRDCRDKQSGMTIYHATTESSSLILRPSRIFDVSKSICRDSSSFGRDLHPVERANV